MQYVLLFDSIIWKDVAKRHNVRNVTDLNNLAMYLVSNFCNPVSAYELTSELDFVLREGTRILRLVQVCYDMSSPKTEKREVDSIIECAGELKCDSLVVVTYNEKRTIEKDGYKVEVTNSIHSAMSVRTSGAMVVSMRPYSAGMPVVQGCSRWLRPGYSFIR